MKKKKSLVIALILFSIVTTACAADISSVSDTDKVINQDNTEIEQSVNNQQEVSTLLSSLEISSEVEVDTDFTEKDLEINSDISSSTLITLNDKEVEINGSGAQINDNIITIQKQGTYVLKGNLSDGQVIVEASDKANVHLVFDGVTLHSSLSAPIYIKSGDKVFITLKEGTVNTLTDGAEYIQSDDNQVDGVIFSKVDLIMNGKGTLNITGSYKHGIVSKDDLVFIEGIYNIKAMKDTINGKDAVKIKDGTFQLSADTGNGIQSKHDSNSKKGYVYIAGGKITVSTSQEGIEGTAVIIDGGDIEINAKDDGINATSGSSENSETLPTFDTNQGMPPWEGSTDGQGTPPQRGNSDSMPLPPSGIENEGQESPNDGQENENKETPTEGQRRNPVNFGGGFGQADTNAYILINGGNIYIQAEGDGIDSNGDLFITGGTLYISGPTGGGDGALDYDGKANISGGTVIAAGSAGMAVSFSDTSTQYSILHNFSTISEGGTEIKVTDSKGTVIASFTPEKDYQSIVISTNELKKDATYTVTSGAQAEEITLTSVVTSNGGQGMGGAFGNRPIR